MEKHESVKSYVCQVIWRGLLLFWFTNTIYYSGFNKDPKKNKIELHVFVPKDTIVGKYEISGKILLLPISGIGDLTFIYGEFQTENVSVSLLRFCFLCRWLKNGGEDKNKSWDTQRWGLFES